jgi:hypothetical protein
LIVTVSTKQAAGVTSSAVPRRWLRVKNKIPTVSCCRLSPW